MDIKLAVTPHERLAVYRFRYSVIVDDMGVAIPAADHDEKIIRDADDDNGHVFAVLVDGEVVGSARINFLRDGEVFPHCDLLELSRQPSSESISVCSRFLIDKVHRGSLLTIRLMQAIYRFMRQSQIAFDFILVKRDLVQLYERIGYKHHGTAMTHPEIGEVIPLRLSILDEGHLQSIRSPLLQCLVSPATDQKRVREQNGQSDIELPPGGKFGFLPAECVISEPSVIERYENNVTALTRAIPLVLRPACGEQVSNIVQEANRTGTPIYPISTGKNWGLGSRLPASSGDIVLDLSRLDRILEVNESLRYAVLEPGVTQGQLARHLAAHHPSLTFNVTGAFGETGVMGNTLERGDGMYARVDDLIGVSGILGNGEPFDVGGHNSSRFSRYTAGPDLVGLFSQSNFAVVTKMTFRLMFRNDKLRLLWGVVEDEKLSDLFGCLDGLFARRVIEPAMTNVGYANRFEQARTTLQSSKPDSQNGSKWNFYVIVNSTLKISQAICEEARAALSVCCEQFGHHVNGDDSEGLPAFLKPLLQPLNGCPDYESIKLVYKLTDTALPSDTKSIDLDQTPFGMKSYVAVVPPIAKDVTKAAEIVTAAKRRFGLNIKISFFGDGRTLVTIHFLKSDPAQVKVAEQAEAEIWEEMREAGYVPYRVNIGQTERLFELRPQFFQLVSKLKSVFDPKRIIAPGRYCPNDGVPNTTAGNGQNFL